MKMTFRSLGVLTRYIIFLFITCGMLYLIIQMFSADGFAEIFSFSGSQETQEAYVQATEEPQCQNTTWFEQEVNPPGVTIKVGLVGGGELCAAYWRSAGTSFTSAVCPQGWVCTFSTQAGTQVFLGTGQVVGVNGATWRPLAEFCTVLAGERRFAASQTPTFEVSPAPGSPSCSPESG